MRQITLVLTVLSLSFFAFASVKDATYEVPTSQADLKTASIFKIKKLAITQDTDNITTIKFMVPEELTGIKNLIEFRGVLDNNVGNLSSEYGNLNCLSNSAEMMCTVSYQKLNFESQLAKNLMAEKFQGAELQNRLAIQERFVSDPIGVIRIYFKRGLK